jgi:hypothetical protein
MNYLTMSHADLVEELQRRDAGGRRTHSEQSVHNSKVEDILKINAEYPGVLGDAHKINPTTAVPFNPTLQNQLGLQAQSYPGRPLGYVPPNPPSTHPGYVSPSLPFDPKNPPTNDPPTVKGPPNPPNISPLVTSLVTPKINPTLNPNPNPPNK